METTFVIPILLLLAFGIVELGNAWDSKLKVETAARAGARVGSGLGADRLADYNLLESVKAGLSEVGLSNVEYVVVFNANAADGAVPAGCVGSPPTSQTGSCNVYTAEQLENLTEAQFTGTTDCDTSAPDHWWCPTSREDVQSAGADYVGVWIKARSPNLTQLFGSGFDVRSSAVMRIEPTGATP